jgi:hypothetical protein
MNVSGRSFEELFRLLLPLLGLLTGVWLLRLILGASGAPGWTVRATSLTVMGPATVLLAAVVIHARRFGGYASVVVASCLLNIWAQLLIIAAIVFSVITNVENIFTAPEFSLPHNDVSHGKHILGHLTMGIGFQTLWGAAAGSLLLWLLRVAEPRRKTDDQR